MTKERPGKAGQRLADTLPARQPVLARNAVRKHTLKSASLFANHTQSWPARRPGLAIIMAVTGRLGHLNLLTRKITSKASNPLQASGHTLGSQSKVEAEKPLSISHQHSNVAATQKQHRHEKSNSDWSDSSVSETEYTPKGFERHRSNPY